MFLEPFPCSTGLIEEARVIIPGFRGPTVMMPTDQQHRGDAITPAKPGETSSEETAPEPREGRSPGRGAAWPAVMDRRVGFLLG